MTSWWIHTAWTAKIVPEYRYGAVKYLLVCPSSNNVCRRHCIVVYMCISWYDMSSVPPISTWCHSGGSYELTPPVYNFLLTGGKYFLLMCVVLYTNTMHMLTGLIFQPRPFMPFQLSWYLFIMTSFPCLYKVSESTYCTKYLLWVLTLDSDEQPSDHMCEGYCICIVQCLSVLPLQLLQ